MDLRVLNPYYSKNVPVQSKKRLSRLKKAYSYPYKWIKPVIDRMQIDVAILNSMIALGWNRMDTAQKNYYLYGNSNQIPYPYPVSSNTENGIETDVQTQGSIRISGRPITPVYQNNVTLIAPGYTKLDFAAGQYQFSGCPAGGSRDTYCILIYEISDNGIEEIGCETGTGCILHMDTAQNSYLFYITITKQYYDTTPSPDLTFYPVLVPAVEQPTGQKGALNRQDLERLENNIQILIDVLELDCNSNVGAIPEFLTEDYFTQLKNNLESIREAYCTHKTTPKVPPLPYNTWQKYNAIEQILADLHETLNSQFSYYSGEIYAGEETGLLL